MEAWQARFAGLMRESGWTLAHAGAQLGVSGTAVLGWMGSPSVRPVRDLRSTHLLSICDAFGVRPEWLIRGELPRERAAIWPFTTERAKIEGLPLSLRILLDRFVRLITEVGEYPT